MIRPVLYVDLPGIVYALDQRARARQGEFADFVVAPEASSPRGGPTALLSALWPITPSAHTWLCEDRWHLLGLAQARTRPGGQAWDLAYLAAMTSPGGHPPAIPPLDVLSELAQYALNAAIVRGVHRFFTRLEDERPELELFGKLGFQRYARELTYWRPTAAVCDAIHAQADGASTTPTSRTGTATATTPYASISEQRAGIEPELSLRHWHRHDAWGLLRLYDACTPKRVQVAESLTSDEFVHTRAGGGRTWYLPMFEPACEAYVLDRGVRLGGWLRLRHGRGSQPHQLWLMAHPDDSEVAPALVRFGLRALGDDARPVVCHVREYEGASIDALRAAGFEHAGTHALLVRHLTMRALRKREALATEPRVVYGVRGLGTAQTRLSKGEKTHYATSDH
jgi:hypothetical protein